MVTWLREETGGSACHAGCLLLSRPAPARGAVRDGPGHAGHGPPHAAPRRPATGGTEPPAARLGRLVHGVEQPLREAPQLRRGRLRLLLQPPVVPPQVPQLRLSAALSRFSWGQRRRVTAAAPVTHELSAGRAGRVRGAPPPMRPALLPAETEAAGLRDPLSQGAGPQEGLGAAARTRPLRGDFLPAPGASTTTPEGGREKPWRVAREALPGT